MTKAKFILNKKKILEQYEKLKKLGIKISYSHKTNKEVTKVLEDTNSEFSLHAFNEIKDIKDKNKIWFFTQANSNEELNKILDESVKKFVIDNEIDLNNLLKIVEEKNIIINLLIRMKFQEHRITSGKYFIYGLPAIKVNEIISKIKDNKFIDKLGVHIHRKSQNASEWEIKDELEDSLTKETLERINIINIGGGLPIRYRTYTSEIMPYIFNKIKEVKEWFSGDIYTEPGRFIAGPAVKLKCKIIQVQENTLIVNTSIYNGVLDAHITDIRLLVENEVEENEEGEYYKIKGNTPTRDDIFRHSVKLKNPKVGDEIIFLNAGAYNYTTDFCSLEKLETIYENDNKKIIVIPSSQGCLGKNVGCEDGGIEVCSEANISYDIAKVSDSDFGETTEMIEKLEGDIFVGGDHSITYPLFKNSEADGLIIFDAHADCVNNFSPPTHEDFVRVLVEEKIVVPENILIIGLRNVDNIEQEFLDDKKINYLNMADCSVENVLEKIESFLKKVEKVYLSVDIDVLDDKIISATGYPEKDGMQVEELLRHIKQIKDSNKVIRSDFVEYNPLKDEEKRELEICKEIVKSLNHKV